MTGAVLVVEADAESRERMGDWLGGAGFEAVLCPGPTAPDYTCVGGRGEACPLVDLADIVILDLWLESDTVMEGTLAWDLLSYYIACGKRVVTIGYQKQSLAPFADALEAALRWPPEREGLVGAIREIV